MFSANMTTTQGLSYVHNYTLNNKGADAWASTLNPLLDLFATGIKKCPTSFEEFEKIFNIVHNALKEDPVCFIKVLKFHRLIEKGNGIKWLYYLCMLTIRMENPSLYSQVLEWSWQYPKDFLNLHRITNMLEPVYSGYEVNTILPLIDSKPGSYSSKFNAWALQNKVERHKTLNLIYSVPIQDEIVSYGNKLYWLFINLMTPEFDEELNPMFVKYLSYESGHWEVETHLIWEYLETKVKLDDDFKNLINSNLELKNPLGTELRLILKKSFDSYTSSPRPHPNLFTNKTRRLIKKCFNSYVNLLDNLFKGIHLDGSKFGSGDKSEEINKIAIQFKRSATLAYNNFEKTIKKYPEFTNTYNQENNVIGTNLIHSYLIEGYNKYIEMLKSGKAQIKTTGLDISKQVWDFYCSEEEFDQSIESKLDDMVFKLKISLIETVGTSFLFEELAQKFSIVLDISGSMSGTPILTGLLYMVLMTKVFGITQLYYFESEMHQVTLTQSDLVGTMCNLVKKIYKNECGSTVLESIFSYFKSNNICDKNVIIITDGDCDPSSNGMFNSSNPFHLAPKSEQRLKYIVVNVKESKMNFPFLGLDPDVCYVTGNNPKTLNGLIKALVLSLMSNIPLTPTLVLKCSLDLDELANSFKVGNFSKTLNSDEIEKIFKVFMKNIPPKTTNSHSQSIDSQTELIDNYEDLWN